MLFLLNKKCWKRIELSVVFPYTTNEQSDWLNITESDWSTTHIFLSHPISINTAHAPHFNHSAFQQRKPKMNFVEDMTTEELLWVYVMYPRAYDIADMQLAWFVSDVEDELMLRQDSPHVIKSWARLMRLERRFLRTERRRLARLYNNTMEAQYCFM